MKSNTILCLAKSISIVIWVSIHSEEGRSKASKHPNSHMAEQMLNAMECQKQVGVKVVDYKYQMLSFTSITVSER